MTSAVDAKMCPWCSRWALKDSNCNYIFSCGLGESGFVVGAGCGRSWCWHCGKKLCGLYCDPNTGKLCPDRKEHHDASCCTREAGFSKEEYCCGGHNSHCAPRWVMPLDP